MKFYFVSIYLLISFILLLVINTFAQVPGIIQQEYSSQKQKLESLERSLKQKRYKKKRIEKKQRDILKEIEELDRKIALQWQSLQQAKKDWTEAELALEKVEKECQEAQEKVTFLKDHIEKRLNAFRQMGAIGVLNILFASESLPDLLSRQQYLKMILDEDQRQRREYADSLKYLSTKQKELKNKQILLKAMAQRLEKETLLLEKKKEEKRQYLKSLKAKSRAYQRMIGQLEQARKRLKRVVDELALKARSEAAFSKDHAARDQFSFYAQKGRLNLPVLGKVIIFKSKKSVPGIVIECPWGSQIRAIFDGKVVYNDSLPGYGKVFIIDHGKGYMSLIAQGQSFTKSVGTEIAEGEIIGLSGGGPWAAEGIYLEIRKNGRQINPALWFDLRGIEIEYR